MFMLVRHTVSVMVTKGNLVLIASKSLPAKNGKPGWKGFVFPGGGIEDGDSIIRTAEKETLEEVGVKIKDVKAIKGAYVETTIDIPRLDNHGRFFTHRSQQMCSAEYDGTDSGLLADDAMPYVWYKPKDAYYVMLSSHPVYGPLTAKTISDHFGLHL